MAAVNLTDINLTALKPKVVDGLDVLIKALDVAEDFSVLLPAGTATELALAIKILTAFETVVNKV